MCASRAIEYCTLAIYSPRDLETFVTLIAGVNVVQSGGPPNTRVELRMPLGSFPRIQALSAYSNATTFHISDRYVHLFLDFELTCAEVFLLHVFVDQFWGRIASFSRETSHHLSMAPRNHFPYGKRKLGEVEVTISPGYFL